MELPTIIGGPDFGQMWQKTQRQQNLLFDNQWIFEQLPNYLEQMEDELEDETLQLYNALYEGHNDAIDVVEIYSAKCVESVIALKEDVAILIAKALPSNDDDATEECGSGEAAKATKLLAKCEKKFTLPYTIITLQWGIDLKVVIPSD